MLAGDVDELLPKPASAAMLWRPGLESVAFCSSRSSVSADGMRAERRRSEWAAADTAASLAGFPTSVTRRRRSSAGRGTGATRRPPARVAPAAAAGAA